MFAWFRFTPESIPVIVELILAVTIAIYLFSIKNKSYVLWLLGISLIGESFHQLARLIALSVPALYQSVTPLLGVTSIFIFYLLVQFSYHYRERLYPREDRVVSLGLGLAGAAISAYLVYLFLTAKPHDQVAGSEKMLYTTLSFLLFTAAWASIVLLRKVWHFKWLQRSEASEENRKAIRACYAFAGIFSLKIFIILASMLSSVGVISVDFRIYASLILHIFYLSGLTVVIIDHLQHATSLQMKLVGLSLATILLILSIGGLSIYSNESLLDRSRQFLADRQILQFSPQGSRGYNVEAIPMVPLDAEGALEQFNDRENVEVGLQWPVQFFGKSQTRLFVNRNGLVAFDEPYEMAPAPKFHLEQIGEAYASKLHWEAYRGPAFVAALHLKAAVVDGAGFTVQQSPDVITVTWRSFTSAFGIKHSLSGNISAFGIQFHRDGRVDIIHENIEAYLHEGLVGIHPGGNAEANFFEPASTMSASMLPASTSLNAGLIYDLGKHFRTFVHLEVLPLLWLIVGSLAFVLLIFPVVLRASILRPLKSLLEGAQRINKGKLDEHVQVVTQDEIGNVATGFNSMMDSLREAYLKLVQHTDHLEEEVGLRTDEIRQQKEVLEEQAIRLKELDEMKSRFFANISHDFRTPLNLIMGPLQSILDGDFGPMDAKLRHRHQVMLDESRRLLKLINQLLDLSKMEAGRMSLLRQPVDLVALWQRIAHSFSSRAEMEQKTLSFHSDLPSLGGLIDAERMEQIGYNLIDNALKFTDAGGKVRISITTESENTAVIAVQDTGCGISKEQQGYIFDRFHQVDDNPTNIRQGTGIGLALVQELVHLHQGSINLESEPGFGTTFTLRFPVDASLHVDSLVADPLVADSLVVDSLVVDHRAHGAGGNGVQTVVEGRKRVLVVDDDVEFRRFITEYLGKDYEVEEAGNGRAGLEAAKQRLPHLIVSDLMMPEMDGIAFCTAVRGDAQLDHVPFILLTAKTTAESRMAGLEHGADDYLNKPVDPRELRIRIQNLLDQRQLLIEKYTEMMRLGPEKILVESADAVMLQGILKVVEERLGDAAFSVTLLAEETGMSVRDLQRKIKKMLDQGPKELITNMRIEQAKHLLTSQAGTVSQIAYKVGFGRPEHFMRTFKQHTGMTPGQFMKGG